MSSKKIVKAVRKGLKSRRSNQNVGGQTQSNVAPPATQPAPSLSVNGRIDKLSDFISEQAPLGALKIAGAVLQSPFSFAGGAGRGLGRLIGGVGGNFPQAGEYGGQIGSAMAKGGLLGQGLGYLGNLIDSNWDKITEPKEKKQARIKTEEQKKYETKFRKSVMGEMTDGFSMQDLDDYDKGQDEGWRSAITSMKDDEYEGLVSKAIKDDDPNKVWNAVIRKAQANGKKVNASKPLFLPNTFEKDGKKYAYAIDGSEKDDNGLPKVRFVPIEIGKMPFAPEEK